MANTGAPMSWRIGGGRSPARTVLLGTPAGPEALGETHPEAVRRGSVGYLGWAGEMQDSRCTAQVEGRLL